MGAGIPVGSTSPSAVGGVFYKHQSAYTTEKVNADGVTSKVESVRTLHLCTSVLFK